MGRRMADEKSRWRGGGPCLCYKRCDPFHAKGTPHDRSPLLDHAERPQDHDFSRRDRTAVQNLPHQHRKRGAIRQGLSEDRSEQPYSRDGRPRAAGRRCAARDVRVGAMLLYLADKTKKFIPQDLRGRSAAIEWLFWQMANLGPNSGQNNHFNNYAVDKIPYAMDRYRNEVNRLYGVLDRRLADNEYMAGEYSIADMATYPWIVPYERQGQNSTTFRTSSAGSRPSRRVRRSSVPTPRRRRSTRTRAASAPRKSAPSCSVRPRRRCRRRCGRAGAQARAALRRRLSSPVARAARSLSAETGRSRRARSSRTGCKARSRHRPVVS